MLAIPVDCAIPGLPPRVRSRHRLEHGRVIVDGITSACAEQTAPAIMFWTGAGDYLRVCGADEAGAGTIDHPLGLPPRVRSRPIKAL